MSMSLTLQTLFNRNQFLYSSTNKTDHHSITEILLKVALTRCFYKYNLGMKSSVNVMSVKIHFLYLNIYRFVIYGSTSDNCFDIVFPECALYSLIDSAIVVLEINSFVFLFHSLVDDLCKIIVTTVGLDHSFFLIGLGQATISCGLTNSAL